jgi:hypothetical protein
MASPLPDLFAGSDSGGVRAAAMYTLTESAKMNGVHSTYRSAPCVGNRTGCRIEAEDRAAGVVLGISSYRNIADKDFPILCGDDTFAKDLAVAR